MNYRQIYERFITDRRLKEPSKNYDRHHIIPRALGGSNEAANIIKLSRDDHFFAHLLLAKIHGGKMATAAFMMGSVCSRAKLKISRRNFTWIRDAHAREVAEQQLSRMTSESLRKKISNKMLGVPKSKEAIARAWKTRRKNPKIYTAEEREAFASRQRGKKASAKTKAKMSATQSKRIFSRSHRKRISDSVKAQWQRKEHRDKFQATWANKRNEMCR